MYKSYSVNYSVNYSANYKEFKNNKCDVTIIDDDFEETMTTVLIFATEAVIKIYSKRNLNVAKNLYLL